ncbi:MAG: hypothetical protein LBI81_03180 [Puniceicoccales bacterium]|jgi:hypothetical protein|nr:hypothetical protein [Puniceicoccales bacterium]
MNSAGDFFKTSNQRVADSLLDFCERGTLPNSNLLVCESSEICHSIVMSIARRVLATERPENCLDFFSIRPAGNMMLISVDQVRELRAKIYLSPKVCQKKFAVIFNAECMHGAAANAFLKTLEEPPSDTIIFLTAAKLHALLPTIAGRCSITRLPSDVRIQENEEIRNWIANYSAWLDSVFCSTCDEKNSVIMRMYLLLTQLEALSNSLEEKMLKNDGSGSKSEAKKQVCAVLFFQMEKATSAFFETHLEYVKFFPEAIANLEAKSLLASMNINFMACVENFLMEILQKMLEST